MAALQTDSGQVRKYSDVFVAFAVVSMVIMMIIPLPKAVLDLLLTLNITLSLVVLLVAMYNLEPLDFSSFPSLLLIMTLFRLSLNVSSTRLILLEADAGNIIKSFGEFVLGGNAVVGFIIFLILVIIQFLVITKGAERVAEVAARFTLDAMPGKQMAIDADLNAGLINDQEARKRRLTIQREADFYGAMDGASKFVKGDAIAGIIILIINMIAGFIIGIVQNDMDAVTALKTYTILTVGDGLVTQIPALLVSTATGITVTRAASDSSLGMDLSKQLFTQPKAIALAAVMLALLAMLGLPKAPFLAMAALLGFIAYTLQQVNRKKLVTEAQDEQAAAIEEIKKPENVVSLLHLDVMELEIGYALIPLVDVNQGGDLLDRVIMIRRQCALDLGLILPPIRMRDNMQLKPNSYVIKLKGVEIAFGELYMDQYMAMSTGLGEDELPGIETVEPAFGLPAKWISAHLREQAELAGYTVVDPPSVVATHLTEVIKSHAYEILGRQDVQALMDNVKQNNPAVVEELIPNLLTLGEVQKVLSNLLKEQVPIRDMITILETLADSARLTKDLEMLTEYVRQGLARQISKNVSAGQSSLGVLTLDPQLEQIIRDSLQRTEHGSYLALEPDQAQRLVVNLKQGMERATQLGYQPIVLCPPGIRIYFKRLVEKMIPNLIILSYNEIDPTLEIQTIGTVTA